MGILLSFVHLTREICLPTHECSDVYAKAAQAGHLQVLKWARANGFQWAEYVCGYAGEQTNHCV